jgi:hypothetical protein
MIMISNVNTTSPVPFAFLLSEKNRNEAISSTNKFTGNAKYVNG